MTIVEQVLRYYVRSTGKDWSTFFTNIDTALVGNLEEQEGELWYTHILLNTLKEHDIDVNELKINKDALKALFEDDNRKSNGEFFTPEIWCKEGRTYFDKYIKNWKTDYYIWDICAGSGNLLRTVEVDDRSRLFLSTLQKDDVNLIKSSVEFLEANTFELDFLSKVALSPYDDDFLHLLPEKLQDIILNDKPLIIYANPPYKSGKQKATEVGRFMGTTKNSPELEYTDLSAPAYDIFYQFCFQVMSLVMKYKLTNTYYCFFGPLRFFTGKNANVLLKKFEHVFEFKDGMCLSASEFNDIGKDVQWGIGCTLWKSRGDYIYNDSINFHKDILLEKKFVSPDGNIEVEGKVLYDVANVSLANWTQPSSQSYTFYKQRPVMTSYHTFKGGDPLQNKYYYVDKVADTYLGTLMTQDNLARGSRKAAILSEPASLTYINITEENFWRCVANHAFRRACAVEDWAISKKAISAPNENIEGYDRWVKNAIVLFIFGYKSMMSAIRKVISDIDGTVTEVNNHFFYCTPEEVRQYCHDEKILEDLELHPSQSEFFMKQLNSAIPYFDEPAKELFDWCKTYTLASYDFRAKANYACGLDAWDAGFQQIRCSVWDDSLSDEYQNRINALKDYLRKDIFKFGFMKNLEDD